MKFYHNLADINLDNRPSVITVGMFDGVHLGHIAVINQLIKISRENDLVSIVLTFSNHPARYFKPELQEKQLTTLDEKKHLMSQLGVDILIALPFDDYMAKISASEFASTILLDKLNGQHIVFGYDNHFGHNREGSKEFIDINFKKLETHRVPETIIDAEIVSSSLVKHCLANGFIEKSRQFLNYSYSLKGIVIKGDQLGRKIGFPTANIAVNSEKLIPLIGVYLTKCTLGEATIFGMTNIGIRPTVTSSQELRIETNLFDFEDEIYGQELKVTFLERMRDEKKFESFNDLVTQLNADKTNALKLLAQIHVAS